MLKDYEIKALTQNNYDDIIIYFRSASNGLQAEKWVITNSDADTFRKGELIIIFSGGITKANLLKLCENIPNDFYFATCYTDEHGEEVKANHLRFKPMPKTSGRLLSEWMGKQEAKRLCGECKKWETCANSQYVNRMQIISRNATNCEDFL